MWFDLSGSVQLYMVSACIQHDDVGEDASTVGLGAKQRLNHVMNSGASMEANIATPPVVCSSIAFNIAIQQIRGNATASRCTESQRCTVPAWMCSRGCETRTNR